MTTPVIPPTDLNILVEALKRELAVPGEFPVQFPSTLDEDLANSLADSFAEAQLDGFFSLQVVDPNALTITPGLSSGGGAMVILYAGIRILRSRLRTLNTRTHYAAGGAVYEVDQSANVFTEELRSFQTRKNQLLALILRQQRSTGQQTFVSDGYLIRAGGYMGVLGLRNEFGMGFYGYELAGFSGGLGTY